MNNMRDRINEIIYKELIYVWVAPFQKKRLNHLLILLDIIAFYETEEGNRQYEEWLKTGEIIAPEKSE